MRNEEFEVVKDLMSGRGPQLGESAYGSHGVAPASFREIDGQVLARQYVAHRKFLETEALAQRIAGGDAMPEGVRTLKLRGEQRADGFIHSDEFEDPPRGWLSSLARLFWRR
jgi:hypothetical protein